MHERQGESIVNSKQLQNKMDEELGLRRSPAMKDVTATHLPPFSISTEFDEFPSGPTTAALRQAALLQTQQSLGNAQAKRMAERYSHGAEPERDENGEQQKATLTPYLSTAFAHDSPARGLYHQAVQAFRESHDQHALQFYRSKLVGPPAGVEISRTASLTEIRRMGRARSPRERDLEEVRIGDNEFVIEVCTFFFPHNPPTTVNPQLQQVAADMLWSATEKSRALDYVPRPPARPSPGWLLTTAVKTAWRAAQDEGLYEIARRSTALQHRSQYELALMGL
jgi:hypothetical protein